MDDGFHEIHLSGKQLFALFMATVVVSVVIFLIGVFVGRNVRSQQAAAAEHLSDSAAAACCERTLRPTNTPIRKMTTDTTTVAMNRANSCLPLR